MHGEDPFAMNAMAVADSFSLDELKRAATGAAAAASPGGCDGETENVPLRGRGWFVPFQEAAQEQVEEYDRINAQQDLADGPYVEYCYMCSSWTARTDNPMRRSVQNLIDRAEDFTMENVVSLISQYYRKWVQPRVGRHWSINSIYMHITKHTINPKILITENIRGLQSFIDAHTASAEKASIVEETVPAPAASGEGEEDVPQPPLKRRRTTKRRVDLKEADSYVKMVRTQAMLVNMLQRMRNESNGGTGSGSGGGGPRSM